MTEPLPWLWLTKIRLPWPRPCPWLIYFYPFPDFDPDFNTNFYADLHSDFQHDPYGDSELDLNLDVNLEVDLDSVPSLIPDCYLASDFNLDSNFNYGSDPVIDLELELSPEPRV